MHVNRKLWNKKKSFDKVWNKNHVHVSVSKHYRKCVLHVEVWNFGYITET